MKFYWNRNFPEILYVLGIDNIIYKLAPIETLNPETGETCNDELVWTQTSWNPSDTELDFIGEL